MCIKSNHTFCAVASTNLALRDSAIDVVVTVILVAAAAAIKTAHLLLL